MLADEILGPYGPSMHFTAYIAGSMRPFLLGPLSNTSNNIATEHAAAVVAAAWLLSIPDGLPAHIWADCQAAVHGATARCAVAGRDGSHRLGECLRALQQTHEARPGHRTFSWVRGHADNPFNVLADRLANEARKCRLQACLPEALLPLLQHPLLPWLWRLHSDSTAIPTLRELEKGVYEAPDRPLPQHIPCPGQGQHAPVSEKVHITVATYNCQTLKNRRNFLQQQFVSLQLDALCLHETDSRNKLQAARYWLSTRLPMLDRGDVPSG